jgi:hypothetical protein
MQTTKVGIREFRENLSSFLESKTPLAITRHGATIGIYLQTRTRPSQAELEALRAAGEKLDAMIAATAPLRRSSWMTSKNSVVRPAIQSPENASC